MPSCGASTSCNTKRPHHRDPRGAGARGDSLGSAAMPTLAEVAAEVTGPGGPLEIVVDDVLGHRVQVYKQRMRSMRELMVQNELRADVTFVVQGDRRLSYGQHDRTARRTAHQLAALGVA